MYHLSQTRSTTRLWGTRLLKGKQTRNIIQNLLKIIVTSNKRVSYIGECLKCDSYFTLDFAYSNSKTVSKALRDLFHVRFKIERARLTIVSAAESCTFPQGPLSHRQ